MRSRREATPEVKEEEEEADDTESEETEEEGSEEEDEEPTKMNRTKRACAIATEAIKEAKRAKKSSYQISENCVLRLKNCKISASLGHRLSKTEACCSPCFSTTFRGRDYESEFLIWKKKAMDGQIHLRSEQFAKRYVNSCFLPFYIKCESCQKYTEFRSSASLTAHAFHGFRCEKGCHNHQEPEDIDKVRRDSQWCFNEYGHPPLLQNNISYDLLVDHYVTRTTGMDTTCQIGAELIDDGGVPFRDTRRIMNMFYVPFTDVIANIVHPEFMETDEKFAFPKFADDPISIYYLQVRNTIIAMWLKHPFVEVTPKMVESQIIVRGHARVFFIEHLIQPILEFLTIKGIVNYGAFDFKIDPLRGDGPKVAIIGAGMSGISTARHLQHLGVSTVIFEAKDRYGGRMNDDRTLGVSVGKGAQIIVGNINNPITLLCEQIGIKYRNSNFFCPLIDETGKCFTLEKRELDDQVDMHYNNVLDAIRNKYQSDRNCPDVTLEEMFSKMSTALLSAAELDHLQTPDFDRLLDFHLGNLEFSCGTAVENLSAKEYDHNEKFGNFAGEHAVVTDGAQCIVDYLQRGLDIRLNCPVKCIDWRGDKKVKLEFENGNETQEFDRVVITTSLAVLKKNPSLFKPHLPSDKRKAIDSLGAGLIEKMAVKFDRRFWNTVDANGKLTEYFGKVPDSKSDRSLFNIYYDFSGKDPSGKEVFVLMSYVTAEHVNMVNELSEEEVAEKFVETLRKMFPKAVINPLGQMCSHWGADPYIGMSYTFVPFGSDGDATYNKLKETVDDRLHFAGEHTIAAEPQTMAGAYLSGLREASKIVMSSKGNVMVE